MNETAATTHRFVGQDMVEGSVVVVTGGAVAAFSRKHPARESVNEDAAAIIDHGDGRIVLAVADGMGGTPAGAGAARIAIDAVCAALESRDANGGMREAILDGFEAANRLVLRDLGGSGTTLAVVEVDGDRVRSYHVGDSAVLLVGQRGKQKLFTVAHSPVGYALEAGVIDEEEALAHDERHIVSNMIGSRDMKIEIGPVVTLHRFDTVLLGTDGLFDNLRIEEITEHVRKGRLERCTRALAAKCAERMAMGEGDAPSKLDDVTFLVFRRG